MDWPGEAGASARRRYRSQPSRPRATPALSSRRRAEPAKRIPPLTPPTQLLIGGNACGGSALRGLREIQLRCLTLSQTVPQSVGSNEALGTPDGSCGNADCQQRLRNLRQYLRCEVASAPSIAPTELCRVAKQRIVRRHAWNTPNEKEAIAPVHAIRELERHRRTFATQW